MWSMLLGSILTSAQAAPTEYALMANKGILYINVYKDPEALGASLAHDHAIQAVGWSGKAKWDSEDVSACNISVTVPVNNLQVDRTETRKLAGLEGEVLTLSVLTSLKICLQKDSSMPKPIPALPSNPQNAAEKVKI